MKPYIFPFYLHLILTIIFFFQKTLCNQISNKQSFDATIENHNFPPGHLRGYTIRAPSDSCPCDTLGCPPCVLAKTERLIHEKAIKSAMADEKTQGILVKQADIQHRLFAMAQKYAKELQEDEEKAKDLAYKLQQITSHAEQTRTKMLKAENEAKQVALKAITTMSFMPPHGNNRYPELYSTPAGYSETKIHEYTPKYSIKIGNTNSDGFIDPYQQDIYTDAGLMEEWKEKPETAAELKKEENQEGKEEGKEEGNEENEDEYGFGV